jgi:glycosyltransferase involved in cell wall biosynthesis
MKILIASFTFPPNKDGVSEAAAVMTEGFLRRGWQVDVATSPAQPARQVMEWRGANIYEFSIRGGGRYNHPFEGDVTKYREFLMQGNWDAVIYHAYCWSILVVSDVLDRIRGKKIIVSHGYAALQWVRVPKFPWGLWSWTWSVFQAARMAFWLRRLDYAVYLSDRADFRGFFDHWLAKVTNYQGRRVIPNGVDPQERGTNPQAFRKEHGVSPDQFLFLCVANYSRRKDQGFAVRAFRNARLPNAVLIFIGSEFNEDSDRFQKEDAALSESDRVGKIIWLEGQSREDTLNAFAGCDAFVLSADHEAQPIALLEAMRESKPWIARDAGCIADMPGGICVKTESQMASAIKHLMIDSDIALKLGTTGRMAIENCYNRAAYVESYCALVETV